MVAKHSWDRYVTKLRHCRPMYCMETTKWIELVFDTEVTLSILQIVL